MAKKTKKLDNDYVIVNLTMMKIGDKVLELEELCKYQAENIATLKSLLADWAEALAMPKDREPIVQCGWRGDSMFHAISCNCDDYYQEWIDNQISWGE